MGICESVQREFLVETGDRLLPYFAVRNATLDTCYSLSFYRGLSREGKNAVYDAVRTYWTAVIVGVSL